MSRFFLNNIYYFITCPTIDHQQFFIGQKKDIILDSILKSATKHHVKNLDFGINSNHHHLLGHFSQGSIIPQFLKDINGPSAMAVNKLDNITGRKIWDKYHVYYITNSKVLSKVRGYVVGNPYKHKEVNSIQYLREYKYSSFRNIVNNIGMEDAENLVLSVINMSNLDLARELEKFNANKLALKQEQVCLEKEIINKTPINWL